MQTENFYSKIKENIENPGFNPDWNKSQVWQRIEQKQGRKRTFNWWKALAAGLMLISLAGGYWLIDKNTNTLADNMRPAKSVTTKSTQTLKEKATVNYLVDEEINRQEPKVTGNHRVKVKRTRALEQVPQPVTDGNELVNEQVGNIITTEEGEQEFSYHNVTSRNEPAIVRPVKFDAPFVYRPAKPVEKPVNAAAPVKRERVAILEIPEDEDEYVIAPKDRKQSRQTRLARQVEKTPEATDPSKPNKIWAFVKQSFRNETIPADSTLK